MRHAVPVLGHVILLVLGQTGLLLLQQAGPVLNVVVALFFALGLLGRGDRCYRAVVMGGPRARLPHQRGLPLLTQLWPHQTGRLPTH